MRRLLERLMGVDPHECEEVRGHLSSYVDGDIADVERQRVEGHVRRCRRCRRVLANLRLTLERLRSLAQTSPSGVEDAEIGERLRRRWRERG